MGKWLFLVSDNMMSQEEDLARTVQEKEELRQGLKKLQEERGILAKLLESQVLPPSYTDQLLIIYIAE